MVDRIALVRAADLLSLELELVNLVVSPEATRLIRVDDAADALVIVHFPPQALAEHTTLAPLARRNRRSGPHWPDRPALCSGCRMPGSTSPRRRCWTGGPGCLCWRPPHSLAAPDPHPGSRRRSARPSSRPPSSSPGGWSSPRRRVALGHRPGLDRQLARSAVERTAEPGRRPPARHRSATVGRPGVECLHRARVRSHSDERRRPRPTWCSSAATSTSRSRILAVLVAPSSSPSPMLTRRLELTALGANADLEGRWEYPLVPVGDQFPGFQADRPAAVAAHRRTGPGHVRPDGPGGLPVHRQQGGGDRDDPARPRSHLNGSAQPPGRRPVHRSRVPRQDGGRGGAAAADGLRAPCATCSPMTAVSCRSGVSR